MAQKPQAHRGLRDSPAHPHSQAQPGPPVQRPSLSPHQPSQSQYHHPPARSSLAPPPDCPGLHHLALLATQADTASESSGSSDSDSDFAARPTTRRKPPPSPRLQPAIPSSRPQHRYVAHGRSMSHPFPALFSLKKRQELPVPATTKGDRGGGGGGSADSDSTDDETRGPHLSQPGRHHHHVAMSSYSSAYSSRKGLERGATTVGSAKDHLTGNCMTCGSFVKWPKDLDVFKCAVCLGVNDIGRHAHDGSRDWDARRSRLLGHAGGSPPQHSGGGRVKLISVEHTRRLIKQCLHAFLTASLSAPTPRGPRLASGPQPSGPPPLPPGSLSPVSDDARNTSSRHRKDPTPRGRMQRMASSVQIQLGGAPLVFDDESTTRSTPLPPTANQHISRSFSSSHPERPTFADSHYAGVGGRHSKVLSTGIDEEYKGIFRPLEEYILMCFSSFDCVNSSFPSHRPAALWERPQSKLARRKPVPAPVPALPTTPKQEFPRSESTVFDLDPKLLLVGDFAENGLWWTGGQPKIQPTKLQGHSREDGSTSSVSFKSPQLDWAELGEWYSCVINVAEPWKRVYDDMAWDEIPIPHVHVEDKLRELELKLLRAQEHVQKILLKATETLLKRPGRPIQSPESLRFLLIALDNPLLRKNHQSFRGRLQPRPNASEPATESRNAENGAGGRPLGSQHSGIVKRILGLISNTSTDCQNHMISWFARGPVSRFTQTKDLVSGFLTCRLIRQNEITKKADAKANLDVTAGLIPSMSIGRSPASLYAALGTMRISKRSVEQPGQAMNHGDWQIKAASRVMSLLFAANNSSEHARRSDASLSLSTAPTPTAPAAAIGSDGTARDVVSTNGQLLPTSDFYNSLLDYADLVSEFETWEAKRGRFSFCQYPFLLSIWAKTQILEFDARRQMETKARDALFDSIMNHKNINQFLVLDVRRECLAEDSLKAVSEVIGSGSEDIKKGLRIVFRGEEGVDAGGLRKEWFLLLVREVFNPDHGMFIYDEDSQHCYFNPNSFETSDQFFLVGVLMGLAIYNSTILDMALPSFAFRKLLASAPALGANAVTHPRPLMNYTLDDLAEFRPRLAKGLRQLLEFDGNVETTFCVDFCVDVDKYGTLVRTPLCPGGETKPVTNANRREFVDLYVRYLLEGAVVRQFEPFKRGFFTVCGGSALSLFRPEEIELLIRGSDEELDIKSLRAVAEYDGWEDDTPLPLLPLPPPPPSRPRPGNGDGSGPGSGSGSVTGSGSGPGPGPTPVIEWFWDSFASASAGDQRKLLSFITGSDRIPAVGASTLTIKVSCLGEDCERYPTARTCFNTLSLWRYGSREKLERKLWRAVHESEGFGLK